jgi:membrane-bound metal-dependent hydrolase YbcI (DUF457 family)
MMALQHTLLGTALGLASSPVVSQQGPEHVAAWVAVCGGLALLPDIDHRSSTITRMWGPFSGGVSARVWGKRRTVLPGASHVVSALCGGHRNGTHSIPAILGTLVLVWVASWTVVGTALVLMLATGAVLAGGMVLVGTAPRKNWVPNFGLSAAVATASWSQGWTMPGWLPWAMALGVAAHILGDMLTIQGCPLSWPVSLDRVSLLPVQAGGPTERWIYRWVLVGANALPLAYMAGYDPLGAAWSAFVGSWS